MRHQDYLDKNATVVQRYLMGFLGSKEAKRMRIKIGAAIMVQALARGFLTRVRLRIDAMWDAEQRI